jgi:hypothetical protein
MDMVLRYMSLQNVHLFRTADLPDHFPNPKPNVPSHHRLPILRRPNQVQMDLEYRVCPVPVPHAGRILSSPLLKLSPKGEGFNPPNVGQ